MAKDDQDIPINSDGCKDSFLKKEDPTFQVVAEKQFPEVLNNAFEGHKIEEETERQRIDGNDLEFLKMYGEKNVKRSLKSGKEKEKKIDNMSKIEKINHERLQLIRFILFKQINDGCFGENVKAIIPAKHEELNRGNDLIIEFFDPEQGKTFSMVVGIVFYGDIIENRLEFIRGSIKRGIMERIIYFKTTREEKNDYQERLRKDALEKRKLQNKMEFDDLFLSTRGIPKVVLGFDNHTLVGMLNVWSSENGEAKLKNNILTKMLIMQEILEQVKAFKGLTAKISGASEENKKGILKEYDEILNMVTDMANEKLERMKPDIKPKIERFLKQERVLQCILKILTSKKFLEGSYTTEEQ